jgi:hypothetical protein
MTFEDTDFRQETLDLDNPFDGKLVKDFLFGLGFEFDPAEVECTMIVYNLKGPPLFAVLEFGFQSIFTYQNYLKSLIVPTRTDAVASIVVNCNPFTNGHKFLIEKAATENEVVYLFRNPVPTIENQINTGSLS